MPAVHSPWNKGGYGRHKNLPLSISKRLMVMGGFLISSGYNFQISKIFNIRKEEFLSIILNDNLKSSRYILKLFYTFAFLHPNIDFNLQNFKIKAKNTKITNKEMKTILNFKNK